MAQAARLTLSEEYKKSFDPNVLVVVLDTSLPLLFKCNVISMVGGPASLPLYLYSKDIAAWTNANKMGVIVLPLILTMLLFQWTNDIFLFVYTAFYPFINHFDFNNMGFLISKLAITYLSISGFYELAVNTTL